jgi:RNA polymerase sigma factor (sigma-70 family)
MRTAKENKQPELFALAEAMGGQSALARVTGLQPALLGEVINLKRRPSARQIETGAAWKRLDDLLLVRRGVSLSDIFPPPEIEAVPLSAARSESDRQAELDRDRVERAEVGKAIRDALSTLPPRLEAVLRMRFGMDGEGELTLAQVGEIFGVGPERVRQLEARALRILRHPSRLKNLKPFLESPTIYHGRYHKKAAEDAAEAAEKARRTRWTQAGELRDWRREMARVVARMDTSPVKPGDAFWRAQLSFDMSVYVGRMGESVAGVVAGVAVGRYELDRALLRGRISVARF